MSCGHVPAQGVGGVADLAFAREEDEYVARPLPPQLVDRIDDGLGLVALVGCAVFLGVGVDDRPIAHLHRVGAAGDLDDRGPVEVLGEALGVDGRGSDDQLEVRPAGEQLLEIAEQEVDVEAAFVRLVDDQRVVGAQHAVALDLGEQDAVGHDLDLGRVARAVGEPHLVAHDLAERGPQLLGDAVGDRARGQPARLGVADGPRHPAAEVEADLGQLGGLPGPRLAGDDHDLMGADRVGDLGAPLADRQVGGEGDRAHAGVRVCPARPPPPFLSPPATSVPMIPYKSVQITISTGDLLNLDRCRSMGR